MATNLRLGRNKTDNKQNTFCCEGMCSLSSSTLCNSAPHLLHLNDLLFTNEAMVFFLLSHQKCLAQAACLSIDQV